MSIRMMTWAFHDSPADLSPAQVLVLLALADAADDSGMVRYLPESERSQERLARKTRMSRRSVQRAIAELVDRGLVVATRGAFITDPLEYQIRPLRQIDATAQRQDDALRSVTVTQHASIDGIDGGTRARKSKGKHALPADWTPSEKHRELAAERRVDVELEAESFRAHAEANGREAVVWEAAFRQWLLNARPSQAAPSEPDLVGHEWMGLAR